MVQAGIPAFAPSLDLLLKVTPMHKDSLLSQNTRFDDEGMFGKCCDDEGMCVHKNTNSGFSSVRAGTRPLRESSPEA